MMSYWSQVRKYVKIYREDGKVRMEAEVSVMLPQARKTRRHQKLEDIRKNSSLDSSEGAWPCKQLNLGLTASRTEKE